MLTGATVLGFRRRGKFMLMRLDNGWSVLIHLGMSGRMLLDKPEPAAHEHLTIETEDGRRVGFVDPRRFGALDLVSSVDEDGHRLLAGMGPEPLGNEFSGAVSGGGGEGALGADKSRAAGPARGGRDRQYLCERGVVPRRNFYPRRAAGKISRPRLEVLVQDMRATLIEAIAAGGSSLRDYVQPSGELGYFQHAWKVYGRAGRGLRALPWRAGVRWDKADHAIRSQHVLLCKDATLRSQPKRGSFS